MGLFDAFTFKKDSAKILNKEFFTDILKLTREKIIELAKKEIAGYEKKEQLDKFLILHIQAEVEEREVTNKYTLWVIGKLIEMLPNITQLVYEFLKEKIESL